ncbi:MAG: hypothetical protein AB7I27_01075 [Bacteriovoracaceae bacterium]
MKKMINFALAALTCLTLTNSTPSHAVVGIFVSPSIALAGLSLAVGGAVMSDKLNVKYDGVEGIMGLLAVAGVIILDGSEGQQFAFTKLDSQNAIKLGLSVDEMNSFNSEIDQANFLISEVNHELSQIESPSAQDAAKIWKDLKELVSPETYAVMGKITSQLGK